MDTAQNKETIQPQAVSKEVVGVIDEPTSPDEIHHETASVIANNLVAQGHSATEETVKSPESKSITISPEMAREGIEPAGIEISAQDLVRGLREEIEGFTEGTKREGEGKGVVAVSLKVGKEDKKSELKQAA